MHRGRARVDERLQDLVLDHRGAQRCTVEIRREEVLDVERALKK